jgi:hypothetical protein
MSISVPKPSSNGSEANAISENPLPGTEQIVDRQEGAIQDYS